MATAETIDRVFAMFHATYGEIALTRLASGVPDEGGQDTGLQQARLWWHRQLRSYTDKVVEECAQEATSRHQRFPPTLPELRALCETETRRLAYQRPAIALGWRPPRPAEIERLRRLRDAAAQREMERQIEAMEKGL